MTNSTEKNSLVRRFLDVLFGKLPTEDADNRNLRSGDELCSLLARGQEAKLEAIVRNDPEIAVRPIVKYGDNPIWFRFKSRISLLEEALDFHRLSDAPRILLQNGAGLDAAWRYVRVTGVVDYVDEGRGKQLLRFLQDYPSEIVPRLFELSLEKFNRPERGAELLQAYVDSGGTFPADTLHRKIHRLSEGELEVIVSSGSDIMALDETGGSVLTPLARWSEMERHIDALVRHGLDVNHRDQFGATPLWYAVDGYCMASVIALIRHGADPDVRAYPDGHVHLPEERWNSTANELADDRLKLLLRGKTVCDDCLSITEIDFVVRCHCGEGMPVSFKSIDRTNGSLVQHQGCAEEPIYIPVAVFCSICGNVKKTWQAEIESAEKRA